MASEAMAMYELTQKKLNHAKKDRERMDVILKVMLNDPNDPHHGTLRGYACGCRCDRCCKVRREYDAKRKSHKKKEQ